MIYAMAVTLEGLRCEKQLPQFLLEATDFWAWLIADFSLNAMVVFQGQNMCMAWALRPPKPSLPCFPHRNQYLPKVGSASCCFDSSSPLVREFASRFLRQESFGAASLLRSPLAHPAVLAALCPSFQEGRQETAQASVSHSVLTVAAVMGNNNW